MLHDLLGFDIIIPEGRIVRFRFESGYFALFGFYFKDTPGDLSLWRRFGSAGWYMLQTSRILGMIKTTNNKCSKILVLKEMPTPQVQSGVTQFAALCACTAAFQGNTPPVRAEHIARQPAAWAIVPAKEARQTVRSVS